MKYKHKVSIGLPVYNGENYIEEAIESILNQTFRDFELIISDNASNDHTEQICRNYASTDERIQYYRSDKNLGAARNYTKVFECASGEYFKWAAHDDVHHRDYLSQCVEILDDDPSVVLCHSEVVSIDSDGNEIKVWGRRHNLESDIPSVRFEETLGMSETFYVWGLMRTAVVRNTPLLGNYYGHDRPFLSGLSLLGRFYQVPQTLFSAREHEKRSIHEHDWRKPRESIVWYDPSLKGAVIFPTWRLLREHASGIIRTPIKSKEKLNCLLILLKWVGNHKLGLWRDLTIAVEQISGKRISFLRSMDKFLTDIETVIPNFATLILVDDDSLEIDILNERRIIPFLEKNGIYWGQPENDDIAIKELERLRKSGAEYLVFIRNTFWWLEHYAEFFQYLNVNYEGISKSKHAIVFDIRNRELKPGLEEIFDNGAYI